MRNMSYCRFENTFEALRDCHIALENLNIDDEDTHTSSSETEKAKQLIELCQEIADQAEEYLEVLTEIEEL
jgi:hypothetical protein